VVEHGDVIEPVGGTWNPARALQVSYKCNEGYELVGEDTTECDPKTGQWNTAPPKCQQNHVKVDLSYGTDD
jgi:Sushi repeat (SCR repeat)